MKHILRKTHLFKKINCCLILYKILIGHLLIVTGIINYCTVDCGDLYCYKEVTDLAGGVWTWLPRLLLAWRWRCFWLGDPWVECQGRPPCGVSCRGTLCGGRETAVYLSISSQRYPVRRSKQLTLQQCSNIVERKSGVKVNMNMLN